MFVRKSTRFLIKLVIITTRQIFEGHNFTQTSTFIIAEDTEEVAVSWYSWLYKDVFPLSHSDSNAFADLLDGPLSEPGAQVPAQVRGVTTHST